MEVKKPYIKSIPYEEWNDNASLEKIVDELHEGGVNVITGSLDQLINWGRANSLWSLTFATSCCGIEFMACGCARYDFARFGFEVTRNSPRQADLIMCAGTITHKMAPALKRLYDEMAEPKYVIAVGGCAISGGPFKSSYHVVKGIEEIVPVDVFIPRARRCVYSWLSPASRGYHVRHDAAAAQGEGREVLWRCQPQTDC